MHPASNVCIPIRYKLKAQIGAGGIHPKLLLLHLYIIILNPTKEAKSVKLLTTFQVAEVTGLPYAKALFLIKSMNHIQMGNRYYVSETTLRAFINPTTPILIKEEN